MAYHWRQQEAQSKKDRQGLIDLLERRQNLLAAKPDRTLEEEAEFASLPGQIAKLVRRQNSPFTVNKQRRSAEFARPSGGW